MYRLVRVERFYWVDEDRVLERLDEDDLVQDEKDLEKIKIMNAELIAAHYFEEEFFAGEIEPDSFSIVFVRTEEEML